MAGEQVAVPAGRLVLGSTPGSLGRHAPSEADNVAVDVPAFRIDRLPYPNDPAKTSKTIIDRSGAQKLCAANAKRLCSELEWERACKGDSNLEFPTRSGGWKAEPCGEDGLQCGTPLGVMRMGTHAREWTSSPATRGLGDSLRTAVVRGANAAAPPAEHRCAARHAATSDSKSKSLTFRCCSGEPPAAKYPVEPVRKPFAVQAMNTDQARAWLKTMPEVADLAASFVPFTPAESIKPLLKGGKSKDTLLPWIPAEHALIWSPVHGEEIWVVAGKAASGTVLLFAHAMDGGRFHFGGSLELKGDTDPAVVAFNPESQRELLWSTCWGCGGEGGAITLRDDGRVVIGQR